MIFKPNHLLFIPVLRVLEWFSRIYNADFPCPDLKRNKVGNPSRIVTEIISIRLIVNELTPS